jgi:hypothetical protein
VAVKVPAFTLVMEQTMGCVKKDLLIDATLHCTAFVGGRYKIISSHIKTDKESGRMSTIYKFIPRLGYYLRRMYPYLSKSTL